MDTKIGEAKRVLSDGDVRPVPDPTVLTTAAILREMLSLREILETRIDGHRDLFNARIDGMDKAIALLQVITDRQPTDVDRKIGNLQELHDERFKSIHLQFQERDVRREQTSRDSKLAIDAALQAAKDAVAEQNRSSGLAIAKSETAVGKQIDQLGFLFQQGAKASDDKISDLTKTTDDKISDLKDRLTRIEGVGQGRGDFWGWVVGAVAVVAVVVGLAVRLMQ